MKKEYAIFFILLLLIASGFVIGAGCQKGEGQNKTNGTTGTGTQGQQGDNLADDFCGLPTNFITQQALKQAGFEGDAKMKDFYGNIEDIQKMAILRGADSSNGLICYSYASFPLMDISQGYRNATRVIRRIPLCYCNYRIWKDDCQYYLIQMIIDESKNNMGDYYGYVKQMAQQVGTNIIETNEFGEGSFAGSQSSGLFFYKNYMYIQLSASYNPFVEINGEPCERGRPAINTVDNNEKIIAQMIESKI